MEKKVKVSLEGKTREQKKMIIAQDVIDNVKAEIFIAHKGSYICGLNVDLRDDDGGYFYQPTCDKPIKENWDKLKSCEVCAVGACLMSITSFNNRLNFDEIPRTMTGFEKKHLDLLTEIFTAEELAIMELMFEMEWEGIDNVGRQMLGAQVDEDAYFWATFFRTYEYSSAEKRLLAIMQHIIDNGGNIVKPATPPNNGEEII